MAGFQNRSLIYSSFIILWLSTMECLRPKMNGVYIEGDIIIGGLIPVHFTPNIAQHPGTANCTGAFHVRGYKGVQAMLYAIESINNNPELLPNITLGVDIKDSCGSVDYSIMECLSFDFIRSSFTSTDSEQCSATDYQMQTESLDQPNTTLSDMNNSATLPRQGCCSSRKTRTAAIVGAAFSGVTMAVANLAGLFHVPVISFSSTSRLLSDRDRFQFFFRTVSPDTLQARAMVDILHALHWQLIITAASDNEYGRSGVNALKQAIQADNRSQICVVVDELFSRKGEKRKSRMASFFNKVKQYPKAKVIVLYAEFPDANYFMKEANAAGLTDYVFLASDSWTGSRDVVSGHDKVISAVIGLKALTVEVPDFHKYIQRKIQEETREVDKWTDEYRNQQNCNKTNAKTCSLYKSIHSDGYVIYVIDAVNAVAHALHSMYRCTQRGCSPQWRDIGFQDLGQFLQKVTFDGYLGKNISFDEAGSVNAGYTIYSFSNNSYEYVKIGKWKQNALEFNQSKEFWKNGTVGAPLSVCSHKCKDGYYKIPRSSFPECCWDCPKCRGKTFTNTTGATSCLECPDGTWPNAFHSACMAIQPVHLAWTEGWALVMVSISSTGVLAVAFTFAVFFRYHDTAVVRAASRHLCYILLLGIAMFFVTPVVYIAKPTASSCLLLPIFFGMCFVMVVGTILIKTNRISRIFNEKLLQTGQASFLGNQWQLLLTGSLIVIELAVSFGWVYGNSAPRPRIIYHESAQEASLVCDLAASEVGFSVWLVYNAGMVLVCTYQAFLVRKVPQNYNESKFIAFTMLTICITVLVYIPSYMGTTGWYRTVISCFMFLFIGSVAWVCIFVPKLYIILFRPHKNVAMRPSISSITLGILTPSNTDGLNESTLLSRTNFEGSCANVFQNIVYDDSWISKLGARRVSTGIVDDTAIRNEQRYSRTTSSVRFEEDILSFSVLETSLMDNACSYGVNNNNTIAEQRSGQPNRNGDSIQEKAEPESHEQSKNSNGKRPSVLRFEDEVLGAIKPKKITRRHSDIYPGILKRTSDIGGSTYLENKKAHRRQNRSSFNFSTGFVINAIRENRRDEANTSLNDSLATYRKDKSVLPEALDYSSEAENMSQLEYSEDKANRPKRKFAVYQFQ